MLCLFLFAGMSAFAYDCEVDRIYYNLNTADKTAEVTYKSYPDGNDYSGVVHIPSVIEYDGVVYTVTSIGHSAFYGCKDLTEVVIPNSVLKTGNGVFSSCSNLTSVTVGNSVSYMHGFVYCYALTSITFLCATPPDVGPISGFGTNNVLRKRIFDNATLYVPAGCKERYQQATGWGEFADIQETDYVSTEIPINEENFPDENFRNYLLGTAYGEDGVFTEGEINRILSVDVANKEISSLKGIEFLTALTNLDCSNNQLTSLDVSGCTALEELICSRNQLTALDISNNPALTMLSCVSNQLTGLDVSNNPALALLQCSDNQLTSLDVSNNPMLIRLYCCNNQLTSLDISNCTALANLECYDNQLTSLGVSNNPALEYLQCYDNQLTSLDISDNSTLKWLVCYNNQLESIDASGCPALIAIQCNDNQLTSIDISDCPALTVLWCYRNQIKGEAMDILIDGLPQITTNEGYYELNVYNDVESDEGNVCTKTQVAAAKEKGWIVRYYNASARSWFEYEGSDEAPSGIDAAQVCKDGMNLIYTFDGVRLNTTNISDLPKGIYIVNGKKVTVK